MLSDGILCVSKETYMCILHVSKETCMCVKRDLYVKLMLSGGILCVKRDLYVSQEDYVSKEHF
jgi:hypothetical protein